MLQPWNRAVFVADQDLDERQILLGPGPSTASFAVDSSVIARSASFIAASFWPSTA